MRFSNNMKSSLNKEYTILVDERALYFEDPRLVIVDTTGNRHVVLKSTGLPQCELHASLL
jgi:hypothetical protein